MNRSLRFSVVVLVSLGCLLASGCKSARDPVLSGTAPPRTSDWAMFLQGFLDHYFELRPDVAVSAGKHEYDGRLPDWSRAGFQRYTSFLKDSRAAAEKRRLGRWGQPLGPWSTRKNVIRPIF